MLEALKGVESFRTRVNTLANELVYLESLEGVLVKHYDTDAETSTTRDCITSSIMELKKHTDKSLVSLCSTKFDFIEQVLSMVAVETATLEKMLKCLAGISTGCTEDAGSLDWLNKVRLQESVVGILCKVKEQQLSTGELKSMFSK